MMNKTLQLILLYLFKNIEHILNNMSEIDI